MTKEVTVPSIQAENDDCLQINIVDRDNKVNPTNSDGEPKMSSIDFFAYCRQQAYSIMGLMCKSLT